ncbi:hypothetical protein CERSUDRAFT_32068, partial [Gelatoporia subvermispora B]
MRDEVGLVRAISVKERSSSQRKERFKKIQLAAGVTRDCIRTLVVDMKVRWSSTYMMLNRAYSLRNCIEAFLEELGRAEQPGEARRKIYALIPSKPEWERVKLFQRVLATADECQQRFSSERAPALHLALPALEDVHITWSRRLEDVKYSDFKPGLSAGLRKVEEYYERIADNDTYIMSMVLDPARRLAHIQENWSEDLYREALALVKKLFRERYMELNVQTGSGAPVPSARSDLSSSQRSRGAALAALSGDESDGGGIRQRASQVQSANEDIEVACDRAFRKYLDYDEGLPTGMSRVEWWGLNGHHFPVWASLARDYLAVLATSVSSERAFSSAGITITKRRNRLKGDIVEALQVLKSAFRNNLFLFDCGPSSVTEADLEDAGQESESRDGDNTEQRVHGVDDDGINIVVEIDSDTE